MNQRTADIMKRICLAVLCLALTLSLLPAGRSGAAAEENAKTGTISASFPYFTKAVTWEYPYSDDFFLLPSDEYHHSLAQCSMGMAYAAFRDTDHPEAQDDYLIDALEQAGFGEIDTQTYRTEPTAYSIAYGFARKKTGDVTVIACMVCGGNYGKEWASNLTVGTGTESQGFAEAAHTVEAALDAYLQEHPAEGTLKLWITGHSRGAAVANITAADCTDSGRYQDVYAYCFATPRTTREPRDYRNIFNIIGKDDPVPKIPLADWGFQRYGVDMLLFSPETDPDAAELVRKAADLYQEMTGSVMVMNAQINYQIRTIMDYLLYMFPNAEVYTDLLQPVLVDVFTGSEDTGNAIEVLMTALKRFRATSEEQEKETNALQDYLASLLSYYVLQDRISELPPVKWDPKLGINNLYSEHLQTKYICRMFASDDPNEIFSDQTGYVRLVIYGNAEAEIADGDKVLKTVLTDGKQLAGSGEDKDAYPYVDTSRDKMEISLAADRNYTVTLTSKSGMPQVISYAGNLYSGDTIRATTDPLYSHVLNAGEKMRITTDGQGRVIDPEKSDHTEILNALNEVYSPTTVMMLENNEVMHLTIPGLVNRLVFLALFLLAQGIAWIVLAVRRKKKGIPKNLTVSAVWHGVNVLLFTICELAMWYFIAVVPLLRIIPMILVCLVLLSLAWMRYRRNKFPQTRLNFLIYAAVLTVYAVLNGLFAGKISEAKGIAVVVIYIAFFAAAMLLFPNEKTEDARAGRKVITEKRIKRFEEGKIMNARKIIGTIMLILAVAFTVYLSVIMIGRINAVVLKATYKKIFIYELIICAVFILLAVDVRFGFTGMKSNVLKALGWVLRVIVIAAAAVFLFFIGKVTIGGFSHASNLADHAIVLGLALENGKPTQNLLYRLDKAEAYLEQEQKGTLILTGGNADESGKTEAETMRDILAERGVAEERMILEDKAETTEENFANVAKIVDPAAPIVLISSDYHMDRASQTAGKAGFSNILRMPAQSVLTEYGANVMWEVVLELNDLIKSK